MFYDGVVPGAHTSGHWKPMEALPPNKSCPQGKGITPLPLPKAKLMTLRPSLMVPETDIRITAGVETFSGLEPNLGGFNLTHVDGNLSGIDFHLS